jgi:Flp pilus assembly pilin Flp
MKFLSVFCFDKKGGGVVEYALIIVLVALAAIATMNPKGRKSSEDSTIFSNKL